MASFIPNVTDLFPEPSMYRPDFSFLDTMLRRRQAMYNQGFAELSSKYSALAKNLTNPYNSKVRNQFLQEAQNELKNLSAMDLSQQQNVQAATNVFTPLYGNQNVMGDLAATAHWDQQEKIAESLRLKDGGKEFSQDNIDFVRMQRNAFAQDNPENVGTYLNNKRYYTPYYDYAKEYKEAMAAYKPNKSKITRPDGRGYLVTEEDGSYDAEDVKLYLSNVLSTKAKSQMAIEGVVRYSNNPAIFDNHTKGLGKTEKYLETRIQEFEGKMMAEKDPEKKKQYESGLEMLKVKLEEVTTEKTNMLNPEYVKNNRENIASNLYYSDKIEELSKGYARKDYTYEMKADDVYLTRLREAGLNQRHRETLADNEKNRANDRLLKQVDLGLLTFDTRGNIVRVQDEQFITPTNEIKPGTGYQQFQEQKKSVIQAQADAQENLKKYFYATNPIFEQQGIKINDKRVQAAFDQFIVDQTTLLKDNPKSNKISTRFLQYRSAVEAGALQLATFDEKERKANAAFKEDVRDITEQVKQIFGGESKQITLYDSKTRKYETVKVTPEQFVQIFMNSKSHSEDAFYNDKDQNYIVQDRGLQINIGGKKVQYSGFFKTAEGKVFQQAFDLLRNNRGAIVNASQRFNQMYDQQYAENEVMLRPINEKDPLVIAAKNNMQNATLVPADNIIISGYNRGKYMFGFKAGIDKDKLPSEEELAAMGVKRAPGYTDENPKFVVESSLFAPRTGETPYSSKEQVIVNFFEGMGNATERDREVVYGTPSGMLTVGQGLNPIQIVKTSRYGQPDTYDIKDELTGIIINPSAGPLNIDQVIETMRRIEADPTFFARMRNFKSK
jgi:hypothetical protein